MAFAPIALTIPQYENLAGYWIKAYAEGTSTPVSMATDATGTTLIVKAPLDTLGFPLTSIVGARFIPFIDGDYDLFAFPTKEDADANITVNAIQLADDINADPQSSIVVNVYKQTNTVATMVADTTYILGDFISTSGYIAKGDPGNNSYEAVAAGTANADGGEYIDLPNTTPPLQAKALFPNGVNLRQWGMVGDGIVDDMQQFINACLFMKNTGDNLHCLPGNYLLVTGTGSAEIEGFSLLGSGVYSPITPTDYGCVFSITGTVNNPFKVGRGGQFRGVNFFYPDQVTTNPPTVYPTTLFFDYSLSVVNSGNVQGVVIEDCTAYNPYDFIDLGPNASGSSQGNTRINNNRFYSLNKGIIVSQNFTNLYIDKNSWAPEFWQASVGQPVRDYVALSGRAIEHIDGDNMWFTDNSIFGYGFGIDYPGGTGSGNAIFQQISGNIFDAVRIGINSIGASVPQGTIITGNQFLAKNFGDATDLSCRGIFINEPTDTLKIIVCNNYFGPTAGHHIQIKDSTGTIQGLVTLDGNQYESAGFGDVTSTNFVSVLVNAANMDISVTDSKFRATNRTDNLGVRIIDGRSVTIDDNKFDSEYQDIVVDASDFLQMNNNGGRNTQHATVSYLVGVITNDAIITDNQFDKQPGFVTLVDLDTTPSVLEGADFKASYTVATTIDNFTNGRKYKVIRIMFTTANHTIDFTGSNLKGNAGVDWTPKVDDHMTCWYDGANWYCDISNNVV